MIKIVSRKGLSCPIIFCDYCQCEIEKATEGNYEYRVFTDEPSPIFFAHKKCSRQLEASQHLPTVGLWGTMELEVLPIYLGHNLRIKWGKARQSARFLASC